MDFSFTEEEERLKQDLLDFLAEEVTPEVEKWASSAGKGFGGMLTKVQAAKRLAENDIPTVIVNGMRKNIIRSVLEGMEVGTLFLPKRLEG